MAIQIAPMHWPDTAKAALTPTEDEMKRRDAWSSPPCPTGTCAIPLHIMIGFDGTNNNLERDLPDRGHTNVARLFRAFPDARGIGNLNRVGHYHYYIPGVGTPFPDNKEWRESADGKVKGKGARERVLMGVAAVFNAVYRHLQNGNFMLEGEALTEFIQEGKSKSGFAHATTAEGPNMRSARVYAQMHSDMERVFALSASHTPAPGKLGLGPIDVHVFGFSRGSMQAVAFCHEFAKAFPKGTLCGVPIGIKFLGLMDCVSSAGLADTATRFHVAPFTGHSGPGDLVTKALPVCVKKAVHLVAGHEQRTAFPLDLVQGADMDTYVYPGVHSNVGGGYGPNAQGRAPEEDQMLSQIPLIHMHRLACSYGVPLLPYLHMDAAGKQDFALSPQLVKAWNAYMLAMDSLYVRDTLGPQAASATPGQPHPQGLKVCGNINMLLRQHMRMRYAQLARYLQMQRLIDKLPGTPSPQEREDLISSINNQLPSDCALCQIYFAAPERMSTYYSPDEQAQFDHYKGYASLSIRALGYWRSRVGGQDAYIDRARESAWIYWAYQQVDLNVRGRAGAVQGTDYFVLMHQHVNDSLAGFYLLGFASDAEKAEKIEDVVAKHQAGQKLSALESRIYENYSERVDRLGDKTFGDMVMRRVRDRNTMSPEQFIREDSYSANEAKYIASPNQYGQTVIPVLTDSNVSMLLADGDLISKAAVPEITSTRREGGGYLLQRGVFLNGKRQQLAE